MTEILVTETGKKKYSVVLSAVATVQASAEIDVVAENEEEAEETAIAKVTMEDWDCNYFIDDIDDIEVEEVNLLKDGAK